MPIRFRCPSCEQLLAIGTRKAGTLVDCPTCGRTLRVPSPDVNTSRPPGTSLVRLSQQPGGQLAPQHALSAPIEAPPRHEPLHAGFECISLASLVQRVGLYERLPVLIQSTLRNSVLITVAMNLICIPVLWLVPSPEWALSPVTSNGFFLGFTADVVNLLLKVAYVVAPFLLVLNVASLLLTLIVLLLSWGFTKPVDEAVHWFAWSAAFPSGATTLSAVFWALLFIAIVVITLVIWIVVIALAIAIIIGVLKAIG